MTMIDDNNTLRTSQGFLNGEKETKVEYLTSKKQEYLPNQQVSNEAVLYTDQLS